ncbi:MAG: dehydratase [Rhodovulum sulfidophilum]|uniref:Dehydratase n=1 Tax=Rhodovulum sulfidophilum TaxID=35806 RepID=A0A2W5Q448_RHOSU|nr:MAG: dehydratase [Rhodovulum sulfidophilum]
MPEPLYLEDLTVGRRFESGSHPLTAEAIKAFAAEFDPQPFHLDEEAAAASFFGGLAASGWHVACFTMRLLVTETLPIAGGLIGAGVEIDWPRPTRPGEVLRVVAEVVEIRPSRSKPDRGIALVRSETINARGEPAMIMTSKMLVFRRP